MTKNLHAAILAVFIAVAIMATLMTLSGSASASATSQCDVTSTTITIGNQAATTILTNNSYQWAIVEQPTNATNTVSLAIGSTAVNGRGLLLTPATTTSPVPLITLGFAPNLPFRGAISAITSSGTTTVNVTSCK